MPRNAVMRAKTRNPKQIRSLKVALRGLVPLLLLAGLVVLPARLASLRLLVSLPPPISGRRPKRSLIPRFAGITSKPKYAPKPLKWGAGVVTEPRAVLKGCICSRIRPRRRKRRSRRNMPSGKRLIRSDRVLIPNGAAEWILTAPGTLQLHVFPPTKATFLYRLPSRRHRRILGALVRKRLVIGNLV